MRLNIALVLVLSIVFTPAVSFTNHAQAAKATRRACKPVVASWQKKCMNPYVECMDTTDDGTPQRKACIEDKHRCEQQVDKQTIKRHKFSLWDCI